MPQGGGGMGGGMGWYGFLSPQPCIASRKKERKAGQRMPGSSCILHVLHGGDNALFLSGRRFVSHNSYFFLCQ